MKRRPLKIGELDSMLKALPNPYIVSNLGRVTTHRVALRPGSLYEVPDFGTAHDFGNLFIEYVDFRLEVQKHPQRGEFRRWVYDGEVVL